MTEKLNFKLHLILIHLNSHMWLVATLLQSTALDKWKQVFMCQQPQALLFFVCVFLGGLEAGLNWYFSCYRTQLSLFPMVSKVALFMERVHFSICENCIFFFLYQTAHLGNVPWSIVFVTQDTSLREVRHLTLHSHRMELNWSRTRCFFSFTYFLCKNCEKAQNAKNREWSQWFAA